MTFSFCYLHATTAEAFRLFGESMDPLICQVSDEDGFKGALDKEVRAINGFWPSIVKINISCWTAVVVFFVSLFGFVG